ncbi:MAG TPA: copper transporter [Acidimicrobiales bacterium]|nr:copper transporter [Acidimicrobiales bacterium]
MVSFRFHLVSLIGIFLALGIGIAVGATVVDQATVDYLERQVRDVGSRAARTNAENDRLAQEVARWDKFADEAGDELVDGRLAGRDVLVVAVQGIDRQPVERLRQSIVAAGGRLQATVWLTSKLRLDQPGHVQTLSEVMSVSPASADLVRRNLIDRLAAEWARGGGVGSLTELRESGFVQIETQAGSTVPLVSVPLPGTRFVVVGGHKAEVPDEQLARPFAAALARQAPLRVLAAESEKPGTEEQPPERGLFVGPLRADEEANKRLSTVDNLESYRGRVAAILAIADLGPEGKVGHFGVGPRASRLVPEPVG